MNSTTSEVAHVVIVTSELARKGGLSEGEFAGFAFTLGGSNVEGSSNAGASLAVVIVVNVEF